MTFQTATPLPPQPEVTKEVEKTPSEEKPPSVETAPLVEKPPLVTQVSLDLPPPPPPPAYNEAPQDMDDEDLPPPPSPLATPDDQVHATPTPPLPAPSTGPLRADTDLVKASATDTSVVVCPATDPSQDAPCVPEVSKNAVPTFSVTVKSEERESDQTSLSNSETTSTASNESGSRWWRRQSKRNSDLSSAKSVSQEDLRATKDKRSSQPEPLLREHKDRSKNRDSKSESWFKRIFSSIGKSSANDAVECEDAPPVIPSSTFYADAVKADTDKPKEPQTPSIPNCILLTQDHFTPVKKEEPRGSGCIQLTQEHFSPVKDKEGQRPQEEELVKVHDDEPDKKDEKIEMALEDKQNNIYQNELDKSDMDKEVKEGHLQRNDTFNAEVNEVLADFDDLVTGYEDECVDKEVFDGPAEPTEVEGDLLVSDKSDVKEGVQEQDSSLNVNEKPAEERSDDKEISETDASSPVCENENTKNESDQNETPLNIDDNDTEQSATRVDDNETLNESGDITVTVPCTGDLRQDSSDAIVDVAGVTTSQSTTENIPEPTVPCNVICDTQGTDDLDEILCVINSMIDQVVDKEEPSGQEQKDDNIFRETSPEKSYPDKVLDFSETSDAGRGASVMNNLAETKHVINEPGITLADENQISTEEAGLAGPVCDTLTEADKADESNQSDLEAAAVQSEQNILDKPHDDTENVTLPPQEIVPEPLTNSEATLTGDKEDDVKSSETSEPSAPTTNQSADTDPTHLTNIPDMVVAGTPMEPADVEAPQEGEVGPFKGMTHACVKDWPGFVMTVVKDSFIVEWRTLMCQKQCRDSI